MRIISGICRGRKLAQIQGYDIRPTSDRVREAIFSILGPGIRDARVLDLFAGTGALGLEALSRGAQHAVFMDSALGSCTTIKKNITLCKMTEKTNVIHHDIIGQPFPKILLTEPFDLIFMDPPYAKEYAKKTLAKEFFTDILTAKGIILVEHSPREPLFNEFNGLDIYRQKKYSKTLISFLKKPGN
jgi:16S rRNA (guanine966-N2)-methyltransferase